MCMVIDKISSIKTQKAGWLLRKRGTNNKLYPIWSGEKKFAYIGDAIIDDRWEDRREWKVGEEVKAGCFHVLRYKRDAIKLWRNNYYNYYTQEYEAIIKVAILPGLLLVGHTASFDLELDPLPCYGCKAYKLIKEVEINS